MSFSSTEVGNEVNVRVLYVDHTSSVGGAQRALLDLLDGLPSSVRPTVMCPPGDLARLVRERGVPVIEFRGTSGSFRLHPVNSIRASSDVARSAAAIARAARRTGAEVVHANSIRAGVMVALARQLGLPATVVHVHDALPHDLVAGLVRRLVQSGSDAVITISDYTTRNFNDPRWAERGHLLYNPLDLRRFDAERLGRSEARARLGIPLDVPLIGVVAQITPWKGQDLAIRAVANLVSEFPNLRLLIIGEPKFVEKATRYDNRRYYQWLRSLVWALDLSEHVEFCGEREDIVTITRALDVLAAPSWEEPFGRSIIEAMAMETPVVATNVGGPAEYIADGIEGLILPPRDLSAWTTAFARLLRDEGLRDRLARAGRLKVSGSFEQSEYVASVIDVYNQLLD
jgi:L-malate glycosyltransferase